MKLILLTLIAITAVLPRFAHADNIDDIVSEAMKTFHIPGAAVGVLQDGKPVKVKGYGLANLDYDVPVVSETPFLLASMTKSFTATCIMMLVEEGKVKLDEPISTYLDDTPEDWKGITVRHLMTHTAGLTDRFEEKSPALFLWKVVYTEQAMYNSAKATPVDFKPGEAWQYSDQGYFLLGRIIERVSGMSYPEFLKKRIFQPLQMEHSSTIQLNLIVKGMAAGYTQVNGDWYHNNRRTDYGLVSHFGIISTVEDLLKWDVGLRSGHLIKPESLQAMWTLATLNDGSAPYSHYGDYGMGWFVDEIAGHRLISHGGSTGTAYLHIPDKNLTVVVLTNLEQIAGGDAPAIALQIAKSLDKDIDPRLIGKPVGEIPADKGELAKRCLGDLAAGTAKQADFAPTFWKAIQPTLQAQKAGLAALGPIKDLSYLEGGKWGAGWRARYRISFDKRHFIVAVAFDAKGRIEHLELQPSS